MKLSEVDKTRRKCYYLKSYVKRKNGAIMLLIPLKFDENLPSFAGSYLIILKKKQFLDHRVNLFSNSVLLCL